MTNIVRRLLLAGIVLGAATLPSPLRANRIEPSRLCAEVDCSSGSLKCAEIHYTTVWSSCSGEDMCVDEYYEETEYCYERSSDR